MRGYYKFSLWLLLFVFTWLAASYDAAADVDRDKNKRSIQASANKTLGVGNCNTGTASADLDINNVRARLYNTGGLFWKGAGPLYNVPKGTQGNSIFASGIWLGGLVNGELRFAGSTYGPYEFWPGPLDENGNPPADCSVYDRMFKVSREDIIRYEETGEATSDMLDWPWQLGAPVIDGDGNPNNYDLAAGDRPAIIGDQSIWWVMNDMGNAHNWGNTAPIGVEVQVMAFAFKRADALNNTTFYKYKIINKGGSRLENAYFGIWSDPDLGNAGDDFVGSDTLRGIGYVYNGDDFDEGADGYGDRPPALGYDYFQGPLVNNDGVDNDGDGEVDEPDERIAMSRFVYYNNDATVQGNPGDAQGAYKYLQGLWLDNTPMTEGGSGYGGTKPTRFMFPGTPEASACIDKYWSEENTLPQEECKRNTPADRRFLMSSGPFVIEPGDAQEIIFGIVWAQAGDRLSSVAAMRRDDALAQAAFDANFELPGPPDAPRVTASTFDGTAILKWTNPPSSNNYLESYDVENPFLKDLDVPDKTYTFEGYKVYQYSSPNDQRGTLIATYDVKNGVTVVVDDAFDEDTGAPIKVVTAKGSDSGVRHSIVFQNLTNYQDYYYGVQAYAYNEFSTPKVVDGPVTRITVRPTRVDARNGGMVIHKEALNTTLVGEKTGKGGGTATARVVDPTQVTGDTYKVEFYELELADGSTIVTYDITNTNTGRKIIDGRDFANRTGKAVPQVEDVVVDEGLSWTVVGPPPAPLEIDPGDYAFVEVVGPGGFDPCGPDAVSTFGCDQVGGNFLYPSFNGTGQYVMWHQGAGPEAVIGNFAPNDFEIRFTGHTGGDSLNSGSWGVNLFTSDVVLWVPYEVWNIGPTGPFGDNDPSDDQRLIPVQYSPGGGETEFAYGETEDPFGIGGNGSTDRVYAYPGDYDGWVNFIQSLGIGNGDAAPWPDYAAFFDFSHGRPIQRIIFVDATGDPNVKHPGDLGPATPDNVGPVIRFYTTKPNLPGDVFTVNTADYAAETGRTDVLKNALDEIGITPNPYKGASAYETTNVKDVARFTNMPEQATIRIFTLDGTLIRTIIKNSPENWIDWDLRTEEGLPIASGIYLIHVEVPNVGSKVIKFGVVKKRIQLDLL